jgi:hypothetical protein
LKTDFPVCSEIISFELDGQSRVAWIPRERGMARFYVLLEGEITQQRAEESIKRHLAPHNVEFAATEWFSSFDVQERVADTFISEKGKIILAGDSAHVHSVNGGQGLNTGIADAFALSWRLAITVKQQQQQHTNNNIILQSYNTERRDVAVGVINVAASLVRSTLRTAQEYVAIIEKSAANITGMGITYKPITPLVVESSVAQFVAGAVCPDFTLHSDVTSKRFYENFVYGKFVVFKPAKLSQPALSPSQQQSILVWNVSRIEGSTDDVKFDITTESGVNFKTDFELGTDVAVVIRPDLYVGYVGDNYVEYFNSFLA